MSKGRSTLQGFIVSIMLHHNDLHIRFFIFLSTEASYSGGGGAIKIDPPLYMQPFENIANLYTTCHEKTAIFHYLSAWFFKSMKELIWYDIARRDHQVPSSHCHTRAHALSTHPILTSSFHISTLASPSTYLTYPPLLSLSPHSFSFSSPTHLLATSPLPPHLTSPLLTFNSPTHTTS